MDFYNYTYLYANGYLKKFRAFFNNPGLTYQGLTAILKTYYKHKGWRLYKDDNGEHTVWHKGTLDLILNDPQWFLPEFQKICFNQWDKNRTRKEWQNEPPINYSSDAEDMGRVSNGLVNQDNYGYGKVDESRKIFITERQFKLIKESQSPEFGKIINIYYKPVKDKDGKIAYFVKQFYTMDDGYYTNFDTEYSAEDLVYYFGEDVANDMINCNGTRNNSIMEGGIFINYDKEPDIDITDVNAVNAYAKEQYGTTYNFKHAGYLLTTGELLDFAGGASPMDPRGIDHHNISINGLDLYGFIALGNIRITPENPGFEFCKTPTKQQVSVLQRFISQYGYKAGYFIVDRVNENGDNIWNKEYEKNEFGNIIPDITSSVSPTQKYGSQFANFLEEKKVKRIFVTEEQLKKINESYFVEPEKVRIVEKYLDDNFIRGGIPAIGENGYPTTIAIVAMKGTDGQPAKNMDAKQLFYLLQDKFQHIYNNEKQRDNFLKLLIKDWYYKKIKNGLLSKNNYD